MFAFIRARFPSTPASAVWSDTVAANWMDTSIPFSMAHYWRMSTFQQVDMAYVMFPPVVLDDPRTNAADDRDKLVRAVLAAVDDVSHPDWNQFDRCIIWFAQETDLFGGGTHKAPNGKMISAAVCDVTSGFDSTCQEVGHTLGLHHELGAWYINEYGQLTNQYGCPYSVMSAASDYTFERPINPQLPGMVPNDPNRIVGPYVPAAHLYINQNRAVNPTGAFNHPDTVAYVPATYEHTPAGVRLYARDAAIAAWPARRTVLAVVPPIVAGGDTHFLELRRDAGAYDAGIGNASIVILATNFFAGNSVVTDLSSLRFNYVGRIDLEGAAGDVDYHSFSGRFVVRVTDTAPGFEYVDVRITGGNAWQSFQLTLDEPLTNSVPVASSEWTHTLVAPCPLLRAGDYTYRVHTSQTLIVLQVHSAGYEAPTYVWRIQGDTFAPTAAGTPGAKDLQVQCRDRSGHELTAPALRTVHCSYQLTGARLELLVESAFADIVLGVEVLVGESSPSVMKNYYPERSLFTNVRADNLAIEWDGKYQAESDACWKRFQDFNDRFQEQVLTPIPRGEPERPFVEQISVRELIRVLARRDPIAAHAVAAVVADRAALRADEVMGEVLGKIRSRG
jgi:hypothetical protein